MGGKHCKLHGICLMLVNKLQNDGKILNPFNVFLLLDFMSSWIRGRAVLHFLSCLKSLFWSKSISALF